jgi:hypothetical protein
METTVNVSHGKRITCLPFWTIVAACIVGVTLPGPTHSAELSGVSYTLTPGAEWIQWNDELGLKSDVLYGGRLSLNFGRYIALRGYYFTDSEIETDFEELDLGDSGDLTPLDTTVEVENYGADVSFGLGAGPIVPYLYGGPGIIRFSPDGGVRSSRVGLRAGGGLRFDISDRIEGLIYAEDNMFRLDRTLLFPTEEEEERGVKAPDEDGEESDLRHNMALGAGISIKLGGYDQEAETDLDRAYRTQFSRGLSGASFKIEPYAGWLDYDNGLDDQQFVGARMGLGVGEMLDIMAYYWRGVEGDFRKTEDVQSLGGELDFNLNPGPGVSPHLIIGGGNLDFMSGFDENSYAPTDKTLFIAGAGLDLDLGRRFKADVKVRDYMFGNDELSDIADPDEIKHNWVYSAGLSFGFGGGAASREEIEGIGRERWGVEPVPVVAEPEVAEKTMAPEVEAVEAAEALAAPEPVVAGISAAPEETAAEEKPAAEEKEMLAVMEQPSRAPGEPEPGTMASPVRTYQGDRVVVLPVPTVGEIYVRYGEPGAVKIESRFSATEGAIQEEPPAGAPAAAPTPQPTEEELETALREAIREGIEREMPIEPVARKTPAAMDSLRIQRQLERFESRLLEKIDTRIEKQLEGVVTSPAKRPQTVVVMPEEPAPAVVVGRPGLGYRRTFGLLGANVDAPEQIVFGLRMELGPVASKASLDFMPEVAVGVVDETSLLIAANVRWSLGHAMKLESVNPYVYGAPGLLFFSKETDKRDKAEGILNFGYGISKDFGKWTFFLEHQGVDIFSLHRILAGANLGF